MDSATGVEQTIQVPEHLSLIPLLSDCRREHRTFKCKRRKFVLEMETCACVDRYLSKK